MKKKITILSVIVFVIIIGIFVYSYLKKDRLEAIDTTGIVEGTEVNLASKISGRISELCCKEGDTVQKDSVVIRLESDDLKASVEQASASLEKAMTDIKSAGALVESSRAELKTADADVKNAEAEVEKARVQTEEAKSQMDRVTSLIKEDLVSKADEDRAVTAFESLRAAYGASKAKHKASLSRVELAASQLIYSQSQLASAKAKVRESEAALSLQNARFDDTVIKTPVSGTVVLRTMEPGEYISPGVTVLTIIDMENLWVRIDVEESLIGRIRLDSEARITIDGMPGKEIKGKISRIGRYAEFATQKDVRHGVQDLKSFHVEIRIGDPGKILKPGMTVNVEIPLKN